MHKCENCLFKSVYRDMDASECVCTRGRLTLDEAIKAYQNAEMCKWHITREQVEELQNRVCEQIVNDEKSYKKLLTNNCYCDIIFSVRTRPSPKLKKRGN